MNSLVYSKDYEKIEKIKESMDIYDVDVLVLRLPENVLYLSGYWPFFGVSYLVFPRDGEPCIIPHQGEEEYAEKSWIKDVRPYGWETIDRMGNYLEESMKIISLVMEDRGLNKPGVRIGIEASAEFIAATFNRREAWGIGQPTLEHLRRTFDSAALVDFTDVLYELRSVKTQKEIEILRIVNELTDIGLNAFHEKIAAGLTEAEVAGYVEHVITAKGTGYKGIERCIVTAFVMSGERTSNAFKMFNVHTNKILSQGDPVLIELNVCADGYWSDVTRVYTVGSPSSEIRTALESVLEAQQEAISIIRDGVAASQVNNAAFDVLRKRGYGEFIKHRIGHGIGVHLHEPIPAIHSASKHHLYERMVHSVEPAVYIPNKFGIRIEDIVQVGRQRAELLTHYARIV
jgi:Xaa-Pro aminopeptidase